MPKKWKQFESTLIPLRLIRNAYLQYDRSFFSPNSCYLESQNTLDNPHLRYSDLFMPFCPCAYLVELQYVILHARTSVCAGCRLLLAISFQLRQCVRRRAIGCRLTPAGEVLKESINPKVLLTFRTIRLYLNRDCFTRINNGAYIYIS